MDSTKYTEYLKSEVWKSKARQRTKIDNDRCVMCGSRGTPNNPLEVHHLTYRHKVNEKGEVDYEEFDENIYTDLVTLCHVCHKSAHSMMNRVTSENGRRGWKSNSKIPQIHVFNMSGNLEFKEQIE